MMRVCTNFLLLLETSLLLFSSTSALIRIPLPIQCSTVAFWSRHNTFSSDAMTEGGGGGGGVLSTTSLSATPIRNKTINHNHNHNHNSNHRNANSHDTTSASASASTNTHHHKNHATFKNMEEVLECFHEEPIGVFFGTNHCGPCHSMKEEMKQVHSTFGNELLLFQVDIDKWPSVATKMDVTTTPTLLVLQQGKVHLRLEGMVPAATILKELSSFLGHRDQQR